MCAMPPAISARRERERDIVDATRALFDERGLQDAPIEEIARAVGINKALIYRVFASKEELFVLTVTTYLDELRELAADTEDLRGALDAFTRFCLRYPAFLDCALSLMQRPARELRDALSDSVWLRLGQGIASCVEHVAAILRDDALAVADPDYTANVLWTQVLGIAHLARIRVGVRQAAPGIPELFAIEPDDVARSCVHAALATVGAR
jgi:AcrR family transcriptional regulator